MQTIIICTSCARQIPANTPMGRCADCVEGVATTAPSQRTQGEPAMIDGAMFGRYQLGPRIGSGGMGVVHKARDLKLEREVALKMIHDGPHASALALGLFREEVKAFARLDHPHVVPIYEAGEHAGQVYFTMKLLPSDLKSQIGRFAGDPIGAAALVEKIALAVRHLHQHGILHRDLKPANILLDDASPPNPYVADFGVAKMLGEDGQILRTGVIVGTPHYMAPEQAAGKHVTWAADVYSLGVILYEVLVRELPFQGNALELEQAKQSPPRDPHAIDPRVDRDLAKICLRCLDREPEHRYPSAVALAIALRRYLNGEPFEGAGRARRLWRWCLRHSLVTGLLMGALLFLVLLTARAVALVGEQQAVKRAQVLQVNMRDAANGAGTVLAHLRWLSDVVKRAAGDEALVRAVEGDDEAAMQAFCARTYAHSEYPVNGVPSRFDLWMILDHEGVLRAQFGKKGGLPVGPERDFKWRDYFTGAKRIADDGEYLTHISRAFRSEHDRDYKFAISTPIYGKDGSLAGVLVAGVAEDAKLLSPALDGAESVTVLAAPRDSERLPEAGVRLPYLILRHRGLGPGQSVGTADEQVLRVGQSELGGDRDPLWPAAPDRIESTHDYIDPIAAIDPDYIGAWSAGFAPVGSTGWVVIVQSLEEETMKPELTLFRQLAKSIAVSAIPGLMLVLFAALYSRRRRLRSG